MFGITLIICLCGAYHLKAIWNITKAAKQTRSKNLYCGWNNTCYNNKKGGGREKPCHIPWKSPDLTTSGFQQLTVTSNTMHYKHFSKSSHVLEGFYANEQFQLKCQVLSKAFVVSIKLPETDRIQTPRSLKLYSE